MSPQTAIHAPKRDLRRSLKAVLPRSLFARSLLILITPVFLIQVITTYLFIDRHWEKMTMRLAYAVAGEIALLANAAEEDASPRNLERLTGYAAQNLDLLMSFEPGGVLAEEKYKTSGLVWESILAKRLTGELRNALRRPFTLSIDFEGKWIRVGVQLEKGVLQILTPKRRLFSASGYIFLLWMFAVSLTLLAVAIIFMRNQIRPIHRLAVAAEHFGKGRDMPSFRPQGAIEVRRAAEAFIDMRERIRRQIEQRTAMLAGVSHDLRTPLTRLKLQLAMLGDSPDVEAMKNDIQQMEKMIGGYLEFVRGEGDEQPVHTDIAWLIDKVVVAAKRQGLEISGTVRDNVSVMLRPMAFERCLTNIINNAGKYAKNIHVESMAEGGWLHIIVDDDGIGIPEDQYKEVFKPFYRVDTSRNAATGGVGLGLPIAMDIVHAHGGRIWLDKSPYGGLRVLINIPL